VRPVNLIPQERRSRTHSERSGSAFVVLGVLAALLVMAVAYVLTSNKVNERTTQATEARQEADALKAQVRGLDDFTDFASIAQTRLASVRSVAETRFDWERFMRELSLVMPKGSWLTTTEASVTGSTEDGSSTSSTATTSSATAGFPTANLVGCTRRQEDVAHMMVRLRQMYRVTDVALNESAQEQQGGETTVDQCGDLYKFDLTLTFTATPPRTEAPAGTGSVPASLGGGS
jgi:Tfp pilus assembly protein PilN